MSFLPENYKIPVTSNKYFKFEDGENKIRILSDARVGFEYWKDNGDSKEVIRVHDKNDVPKEHIETKDNRKKAKAFWGFIIYNHKSKEVQLATITQVSIQKAIMSLINDEDWGDPKEYDIVVNKSGQDLETEYTVQPKPKSKLDEEANKTIAEVKYNIDGIYENKVFESNGEGIDIDQVPF